MARRRALANILYEASSQGVVTFTPLAGHSQWESDIAAPLDGVHPGQADYGLIAWLVLHHDWGEWMG
ncbi:hypothetical protein [Janibacter limosus]|uniref:hypothetical protein n=1 Tax=Janibacter limosus TaxID=53458 RepID=UPI0008354188